MKGLTSGALLATVQAGLLVVAAWAMHLPAASADRCLFISSYHRGYAWSDGVEQGLRDALQGACEIRQFDMDSKRNKEPRFIRRQAEKAIEIIEEWQPDVVITADDNAAKYIIKPHFRNHRLPFVFCGVNWTVNEYGFPYRNVTGMVEVAPIMPLLEAAMQTIPRLREAFYLGADTLTEQKNLTRFQSALEPWGVDLDYALVSTLDSWLEAYGRADQGDLIIIGSNAGIDDWDAERAASSVREMASALSVSNHDWMMPYTMLGMTKVPREQGEYAGLVALRVLLGQRPGNIPVVANRKRDTWVNQELLDAAVIELPAWLKHRAKRFDIQ